MYYLQGSAFGEAPHTTGAQTSHTQTTSHTHTHHHPIKSDLTLQQAGCDASGRYSIVSETRDTGRIFDQHECGLTFWYR